MMHAITHECIDPITVAITTNEDNVITLEFSDVLQ